MKLRTAVFWLHLAVGLVAGAVILAMSVTGVLLAYEAQINDWETAAHRVTPPQADAAPMPIDALVTAVGRRGAPVTGISATAESGYPVVATLKGGTALLVDPYSGQILGEARARAVFRVVKDVHRALGFGLAGNRSTGTAITGVSNALFLFLVVSGFYLWWPRKWSAQALRAITRLDLQKQGRARDWNLHHVIGFWTAPVLFVVVLSGVGISYGGLYQMADRLVGGGPARPEQAETATAAPAAPVTLDTYWTQAARRTGAWQTMSMTIPEAAGGEVNFRIKGGEGFLPQRMSRMTLDAETGAVVRWQRYEDGSPVQKVRSWGRWLHTGEAFGFIGQTLAGLASVGAVVLVWTGLALTWRRFSGKRGGKEPAVAMAREPAEPAPSAP